MFAKTDINLGPCGARQDGDEISKFYSVDLQVVFCTFKAVRHWLCLSYCDTRVLSVNVEEFLQIFRLI